MTDLARPRRLVATALAIVVGAGTLLPALTARAGTAQEQQAPLAGSSGVGDAYFPLDGNGGIDVRHYDIRTRYDFDSGRLSGTTVLRLVPTTDLARFNLDFLLPVSRVEVDGDRARHATQLGHELVVTARRPLPAGEEVTVRVEYAGRPAAQRYAGESNWLADDHEVVTMNEPHMSPWWFPGNDHPTDKATYSIAVTVPTGRQAVANGTFVGKRRHGGSTTWRWRADEPMTTYLAFFAAGRFEIRKGVREGRPWLVAASRELPTRSRRTSMSMLRRTPGLVEWLESELGPYPFSTTGGLVTSLSPGFALENQTRPVYPALGRGSTWLLVHELAHQWFGDSVSVGRWRDIWLNEGAATFMEVRHAEVVRGRPAQAWLTGYHAALSEADPFWDVPIADPGRGRIFHPAVYQRGAMTMQALRHRIGEDDFWTLLRTWLEQRKDGNATSEEFEAMAAELSGEDLTGFFQAWLRDRAKPAATADNGLV